MGAGGREGREIGAAGHHWTGSRDLHLELTGHWHGHGDGDALGWAGLGRAARLELDETGKDRTGRTGQAREEKTGLGRDCNIKPTACSRCNSGGPRPGSTLGVVAWDAVWCARVCVDVGVAPGRLLGGAEARTLGGGRACPLAPSPIVLPACLSPTRAGWAELARSWGDRKDSLDGAS